MLCFRSISKILLCLVLCNILQSCIPVSTVGVGVIGVSAIQRPKIRDNVSDNKIYSLIKLELVQDFDKLYKKVDIQVLYGRVLITGNIASQEDMLNILDIVWSIDGVVEVINDLQINDTSNHFDTKQYLIDTYITAAIKTKLANATNIESLMYNIRTIDNVVYLFGVANNIKELENVENIATSTAGVTTVQNHVLIKADLNQQGRI